MRGLISLSLLPMLASSAPTFNTETIHRDSAPVLSSTDSVDVADSYIVVFKKHVSEESAADHHSWVQDIHLNVATEREELRKRSQFPVSTKIFEGLKHKYKIGSHFAGYSGHFDDSVIEQVRNHPDVEYVEKDSVVHTLGEAGETEKGAPWGLARVSHRDSLTFSDFNKYLYAADAGLGVDVYVIDTGTNTEHVDFAGRAHWGKTIPENDEDEDGNGHGTHCSGTVAGSKYGVAKKANIYAVKVLRSNGSGTMTDVIKGVEWAANAHVSKVKKAPKGFKGSAANMSLGGGKSPTLDRAVNSAVAAGIHFAVAAGNDNADSCNYSPAAAEDAVTVGATDLYDARAYFSNYGTCNDIFAPGLNILSTWIGSKTAVNTISGTSMASPHVAGLLAYYLSLQPDSDSAYSVATITPKQLKKVLLSVATKGALSDVPANTENILAWNGGGSSNFSEIVGKGGYVAKQPTKAKLPSTLKVDAVVDKIGDFIKSETDKISHMVDEEIAKLMKDM